MSFCKIFFNKAGTSKFSDRNGIYFRNVRNEVAQNFCFFYDLSVRYNNNNSREAHPKKKIISNSQI